jgi:hypothetical protein
MFETANTMFGGFFYCFSRQTLFEPKKQCLLGKNNEKSRWSLFEEKRAPDSRLWA